jgi:hypothetical protein
MNREPVAQGFTEKPRIRRTPWFTDLIGRQQFDPSNCIGTRMRPQAQVRCSIGIQSSVSLSRQAISMAARIKDREQPNFGQNFHHITALV